MSSTLGTNCENAVSELCLSVYGSAGQAVSEQRASSYTMPSVDCSFEGDVDMIRNKNDLESFPSYASGPAAPRPVVRSAWRGGTRVAQKAFVNGLSIFALYRQVALCRWMSRLT